MAPDIEAVAEQVFVALADPTTDQVGLMLAEAQLPKRVRAKAEAR